jgi:hypothetical protein
VSFLTSDQAAVTTGHHPTADTYAAVLPHVDHDAAQVTAHLLLTTILHDATRDTSSNPSRLLRR